MINLPEARIIKKTRAMSLLQKYTSYPMWKRIVLSGYGAILYMIVSFQLIETEKKLKDYGEWVDPR